MWLEKKYQHHVTKALEVIIERSGPFIDCPEGGFAVFLRDLAAEHGIAPDILLRPAMEQLNSRVLPHVPDDIRQISKQRQAAIDLLGVFRKLTIPEPSDGSRKMELSPEFERNLSRTIEDCSPAGMETEFLKERWKRHWLVHTKTQGFSIQCAITFNYRDKYLEVVIILHDPEENEIGRLFPGNLFLEAAEKPMQNENDLESRIVRRLQWFFAICEYVRSEAAKCVRHE